MEEVPSTSSHNPVVPRRVPLRSSRKWNDQQLTVDRKWKVEEELAQRISQEDEPSRIVPVAKWIFTILLGSFITVLFVATKISFIYLSQVLNITAPATTPGSHDAQNTSQFLIIFLVIEVPYFLLFLRAAWQGLFIRENPWPRTSAVLCCFLVGVLEPLGIIILALKVLPKLNFSLGVLVMSNVIALSVFVEMVNTLTHHSKLIIKIIVIASCLCILTGLGLTTFMIYHEAKDSVYLARDILHAVVGVACLNLAWLPCLLRHINQPAISVKDAVRSNINVPAMGPALPAANLDQSVPDNVTIRSQQSTTERSTLKADSEATWKASFIIYGVKTIVTFVFSFIFFYVDSYFLLDNFSKESYEAFIAAWDFASIKIDRQTWIAFGVNLVGGFVCYVMVFIASHANMQRGSLAIPFMVSLPLTVLFASDNILCQTFIGTIAICESDSTAWYFIFLATIVMMLGQTLSLGRHAFRKEKVFLRKEEKYFWTPGYNGVISDTWLLLNTRQTIKEGRVSKRNNSKSGKIRVYICTTMYREDESEMQQLLESLAKINIAQAQGETCFEAHIIFDAGVRQKNLSEFSLVLISLLEDTLEVLPAACTKVITPYGMKLSWSLPSFQDKPQMSFSIHLKDNVLVKNKKRWSQVMYMSYVLDFLADTVSSDEEMYILTTDADVLFTPDSVEALLDFMCRDPTVGAVCARTHPMGSGPLVWYQIFEYAIGHWFQKAAEHVLGSVLCAPGCFSVYRCRALKDILPKYCKKVESSFDFLTKDMGEDRWLCTLMVQSGWRIEYCAASDNSTHCPSEFEEFYKQRRRWIASTLANLMLIIKEWKYIALFNHRVSIIFLLYQGLLLFSTLISPSTVILVVAGGLDYAWDVDAFVAVILQLILCVLFAMACIFMEPKTQIFIAKIYTFLYAVIMCAVAVGTAEQIVSDLSYDSHHSPNNKSLMNTPAHHNSHVSVDIPVSITTIYFAFLFSIFLLVGFLHPREITCLFHGVCFLLCIPSAYLILMIYSICNLTDSSWGTREGETAASNTVKKTSWPEFCKKIFFSIFFCLAPKPKLEKGVDAETQTVHSDLDDQQPEFFQAETQIKTVFNVDSVKYSDESYVSGDWQSQDFLHTTVTEDHPISVEHWLPLDLRNKYAEIFRNHGYDNTLFIKGLTETDLNRMGINTRGHVQFLMSQIAKLPAFEIEYKVPTNITEWLQEIGLSQYKSNFTRNHIRSPKEMEILKRFNRNDIEKELDITKGGHIKRLMDAIRMLRDPSESQQKAIQMRQVIDDCYTFIMRESNVDEFVFWNKLRAKCLVPDLKAFGIDSEIKAKLVELRNNWLMVIAIVNTLWLILITTLATKGDLSLLGANPVGLVFLFIFGLLFLVQFLAMLVHRFYTLSHNVARAPYTFGKPFLTSWSFKDKIGKDILCDSNSSARTAVKVASWYPRTTSININENDQSTASENTPLLSNNVASES